MEENSSMRDKFEILLKWGLERHGREEKRCTDRTCALDHWDGGSNKLHDVGFLGSCFTRTDGRVSSRLDRVLGDSPCLDLFPKRKYLFVRITLLQLVLLLIKIKLLEAQSKHLRCLAMEKDFLTQKYGTKWMKEGDRFTSFFHSFIKKKHRRKHIAGSLVDGEWIRNKDALANSVVYHFHYNFTRGTEIEEEAHLIDCISQFVIDQQNAMLMELQSIEEVRDSVFALDKHSIELVHYLDRPCLGGNVLLKIDMSRAFDMLS
ncbi:hypothetical protein LIER_42064 [Lithospermum erythrorhizon]|uniref:Reverse transcriptase n=1 Tax=Lithospermum erythrorhizon TaxID=34254 RepID=A0AAV3RJC4_LITER